MSTGDEVAQLTAAVPLPAMAAAGAGSAPPATPVAVTAVAAAGAGPVAPSPLDQRSWSREVQRAVRLAVTGLRGVRTAYATEAEQGQAHLNQACDSLLRLHHVPSMPLGALRELRDLRPAALAKLLRLAEQHVREVRESVGRLEQLAQEAAVHAESLSPLLCTPWQRVDTCALTEGMGAATAASTLEHLATPLATDVVDKRAVAAAVETQVTAAVSRHHEANTGSEWASSGVGGLLPEPVLSQRSQVWLSVWMLSPRLGDPADAELLLGGLQEALTLAGAAS